MRVKTEKAKAWREFSIFIRRRDTTALGTQCYTCLKYFPFNQMDAGHFQDGRYKVFLFDERQVHAQCKRCNGKKPYGLDGNKIRYYQHMEDDYGQKAVAQMVEDGKRKVGGWKAYELHEIYLKYKALNNLEESRKQK